MMAVITFIAKFSFVWLLVLSQNSTNVQSFQCGVPYRGKGLIFNGKQTERNEHPWKVALFEVSKGQKYFCGGVLIDDETVLTAAHCLDRSGGEILKPADISVLLGAHDIDQQNETGRISISAEFIYIHDKWNSSSLIFNNDVAFIKLNETVNFNQFIRPVCLSTTEILNINNGTVVGWGVYDDNFKLSNYPREVEVPILNAFKCVQKNRNLLDIFDDETMFCAGSDGVGVCQGDSGSGFYVEKNGIFYVRGIVSSGAGTSCSSMKYVLYSNILSNWEFVEKNIMNERVGANCRYDFQKSRKYTCSIENLDVNRPNFRIGRVNTQHREGYSDQDVERIRISRSNFTFLPTFQNEYLEKKFFNVKTLAFTNGINRLGMIPLSFTKTSIVPEQIEEFELSDFRNRLSHLPENLLHGALKLRIFDASSNKIEEISEDFFSKNVELEEAKFYSNAIKSLPDGLWENNLKLSRVDISRNRLQSLPQNLLKNSLSLTHFNVDNNEIESIPLNFFHNNEKLEEVHLTKNKITSLSENLFANNRILKILMISNNKITSLPSSLIANCPLLEQFYAHGNDIITEPENFRRNNPNLTTFRIQS